MLGCVSAVKMKMKMNLSDKIKVCGSLKCGEHVQKHVRTYC